MSTYNGLTMFELITTFCIDPVTGRACYIGVRGDTGKWVEAQTFGPPMKEPPQQPKTTEQK